MATGNDIFTRAATSQERFRALFRLLGFVTILALTLTLCGIGLLLARLPAMQFILGSEFGSAFSALVALLVMAGVTREPLSRFGFGNGFWKFFVGIGFGIALLGMQLLMMNQLGGYSFGAVTAAPLDLARPALLWATVFLAVGIAEETMWRSYLLVQLSRCISFWPAAIALAVLFGGGHLANPGENAIGALAASLFGIVLAISFRLTGSLWLAIGIHAGWDYAESFLFGVPDSGLRIKDTLLHPAFHGPSWLTGGSVGPEGSALIAFPLLGIVVLGWALKRRATAE